VGEIELTTGAGFTRVTEAVADCVDSATLAAVTVTVLGDRSVVGAVYSPVLLITPTH
jgi:PP-loop superfamily ATP-utilizing enzyme